MTSEERDQLLCEYLDGTLSAEGQRQVQALLDGDAALRKSMQEISQVKGMLGALPVVAHPAAAAQELRARLLGDQGGAFSRRFLYSIAAALLLTLTLALVIWSALPDATARRQIALEMPPAATAAGVKAVEQANMEVAAPQQALRQAAGGAEMAPARADRAVPFEAEADQVAAAAAPKAAPSMAYGLRAADASKERFVEGQQRVIVVRATDLPATREQIAQILAGSAVLSNHLVPGAPGKTESRARALGSPAPMAKGAASAAQEMFVVPGIENAKSDEIRARLGDLAKQHGIRVIDLPAPRGAAPAATTNTSVDLTIILEPAQIEP